MSPKVCDARMPLLRLELKELPQSGGGNANPVVCNYTEFKPVLRTTVYEHGNSKPCNVDTIYVELIDEEQPRFMTEAECRYILEAIHILRSTTPFLKERLSIINKTKLYRHHDGENVPIFLKSGRTIFANIWKSFANVQQNEQSSRHLVFWL